MTQPIRQVTVDQLPPDPVVLDVREQDEWDAGHIPGATHVPLAEVPRRMAEVPSGEPVFVVCRGGGRSARAVAWLAEQGHDVVNVDGGMQSWAAAGREMVAETNHDPEVI